MDVKFVRVTDLAVHEEVIEESVDSLVIQVRNWGLLRNPVVVSERDLLVLDGTHRVAAFRRLGYLWMPACVLPYSHPRVELRGWDRFLSPGARGRGLSTFETLQTAAKDAGLALKRVASVQSLRFFLDGRLEKAVGGARVPVAGNFLVEFRRPAEFQPELVIWEKFRLLRKLEARLAARGWSTRHVADEETEKEWAKATGEVVLLPPRAEKRDVLAVARRGFVFPPKSTRHVIPARPLHVDVPLSWVRDRRANLSALNERLVAHLRSKRVVVLPPGQVFEGRLYAEKLFVFQTPTG